MARLCHCSLVSDREVLEAVQAGCVSLPEVAGLTGAGADCGGCLDAIAELLDELDERAA